MNLVWSRRCAMFTVLLAASVAGALAPGRAEAALPQRGGMVGSSASTTIQAIGERVPMAGVQRCSGAIDATGTSGAGIGRLIDLGHGMYDFVLQLNQDFLSQFSPDLMRFGYQVTYSVNGQMAKGLFAGDLKFRAGNEHIHSRQRIQGRVYIVEYMVDLVQARTSPVHGTITCQV